MMEFLLENIAFEWKVVGVGADGGVVDDCEC